MTPVICRVAHRPEENLYGDCIRACVASILNLDAEKVPHFAHDNPDSDALVARIAEFLGERDLAPIYMGFDGREDLLTVMQMTADLNPHNHFILFGRTAHGDHAVVIKNGLVAHDPAWYKSPIIGPSADNDYWAILAIGIK